jgi:hypothetical protein
MADAAALRRALAAFLGEEWGRFTAAYPQFVVGLEELAVALRVCELHGEELLPDAPFEFEGHGISFNSRILRGKASRF